MSWALLDSTTDPSEYKWWQGVSTMLYKLRALNPVSRFFPKPVAPITLPKCVSRSNPFSYILICSGLRFRSVDVVTWQSYLMLTKIDTKKKINLSSTFTKVSFVLGAQELHMLYLLLVHFIKYISHLFNNLVGCVHYFLSP